MEPQTFSTDEELLAFLSDFCEFGENRVYILSAMARPKENESISHGSIPMFREIITEEDELERKLSRLNAISQNYIPEESDETLQFRLYITANARDTQKAFFQFQKKLIDMQNQIQNGHSPTREKIKRLDKDWESTLQSDGNKEDNYFIIDIDDESLDLFEAARDRLSELTTIKAAIETPNGYHIITHPFNYNEFEMHSQNEEIELDTDGLTFLTFI